MAQLDDVLARAPFNRVREAERIDLGDPTLQRRRGYRSILRAFLAARAGLSIRWPELSEVVFAETRDVPQLYEIWCLIQLRKAIEVQFDVELSMGHFHRANGSIAVRRGSVATASAPITINDQAYRLSLWYNRTFSPSAAINDGIFAVHAAGFGTWSKPMKPDFTIELSTAQKDGADERSHYFHLDAKYRLKALPSAGEILVPQRSYAADDIDKMHAYLAGIRDSRAAHILYPGDRTVSFRSAGASDSVGAFSAAPGRVGALGPDLRSLIETTFACEL